MKQRRVSPETVSITPLETSGTAQSLEAKISELVHVAARVCRAPLATVSFIDEQQQHLNTAVGLADGEKTPGDVFRDYAIRHQEVFSVSDAQADPRFLNNPAVTSYPHVRFYAGAPLLASDGSIIGALSVMDPSPRDITEYQSTTLQMLASQIVNKVELQRILSFQSQLLAKQKRLQGAYKKLSSESNLADATLRESKARLQNAFESAAVGASIADMDGRFVFVNAALCRIVGYSEQELLAMKFMELTHPDDVDDNLALVEQLIAEEIASFTTEKRFIRKDNCAVWVKISVTLGRDAQGKPEHTLAIIEDITAEKQAAKAEAELRERTSQLLAVGETLGAALTTAQVAVVILEAAQPIFQATMVRACLLSSDEGRGGGMLRTLHAVGDSEGLLPEWEDVSVSADVPLAVAVRERRLVVTPIREAASGLTLKDAAAYHTLESVVIGIPLMVGERCIGGLGLICPTDRCQTEAQQAFLWTLARQCALALERARLYDAAHYELIERQKAEAEKDEIVEYNRLLLESTAEGIYGIDTAGRCTFMNRAATRLLGCTAEEVLGEQLHNLIHHTHNDGTPYPVEECPIYNAFRTGTACHVDTEVMWRCDGTSFPASYASFPMVTADEIVGAVVTFTNITERFKEQMRAQALIDAEERANRDSLTGLLNHRAFQRRLEEETDRAQREGTCFAVAMLDLDSFKFFNDFYGHIVGDQILVLVADALQAACRSYDVIARFGGDEFSLLLLGVTEPNHIDIEKRLKADLANIIYYPSESSGGDNENNAEARVGIPINISVGVSLFPNEASERGKALEQADARLRRAKTSGATEIDADHVRLLSRSAADGFSMLDALVTAVDNKDRYTRSHSEDVMKCSVMIARELGWSEEEIQTVSMAALLHDVGKIGVPDAILRKPGKLTSAEFLAVRQHPTMGAALVSTVPGLEATLPAVRHHHEQWDGGGYPSGLSGEETPLIARLMAVADAFSAMTTDRPYRRGMQEARAVEILKAGAGAQWDAACVAAFVTAQARPGPTADLPDSVTSLLGTS